MIKLVTIDLDGTLLTDSKEITKENIEAIKKAKEKGVQVVLATGRPIEGVSQYLKILEMNEGYLITFNGALIKNLKTNEVLHSTTISGAAVKEIYQEALRLNVNFHAFTEDDELITNEKNPYTAVEERINGFDAKVVDVMSYSDQAKFLKAMLVYSENELNIAEANVSSKLKNELTMVRSSKIFLEFLNKDSDKGKALLFLRDYLGLKDEETMAIGDAGNDLPMIKASGNGVAMINGMDYVKKEAKIISSFDNNNSGVADIFNKYVLI